MVGAGGVQLGEGDAEPVGEAPVAGGGWALEDLGGDECGGGVGAGVVVGVGAGSCPVRMSLAQQHMRITKVRSGSSAARRSRCSARKKRRGLAVAAVRPA
jgi:hypothetical protein